MSKKKKLCLAVVILTVIWAVVGVIDFSRVHRFEKPIFCIGTETADDGGSGRYVGLGYSFDIKGNFMPEDELPGVTEYSAYLFGCKAASGRRD
ncbi:MAG: hypothetical protein NC409_13195 [Clostridium sp.]|nr:hypothetical protein [Clostridium sp.]